MTIDISNNAARVNYTVASGVTQSSFSVPFEFFNDSDLSVYVADVLKTITTHYTVSGGDGSTGTVTISVTGASGGTSVVISRSIAIERTSDFVTGVDINRAALNTQLDTLTAIAADNSDKASRSISAPNSEVSPQLELPDADTRKGKVLGFNASTGNLELTATVADVDSLASITADIATLADIEDGTDATDAIQTVAGVSANVTTVAGVSSNVTTVAGISANVTTVAGDSSDIATVAGDSADIQTLADISSDITTAAGISANITTVAGDSTDIQGLAAKTTQIGLLGTTDAIADMNTLGTAAIVADLDALADISSNISTVADVSANVTTVAGVSANVTTVAGVSANVTTVAGVSSDVTTVAGISADVTTVAADGTDIGTVAGISGNVTTVAGVASNVTTVAGISSDVTAVANISQDIQDVQDEIAALQTVANDLNEATSEIETVAGSIANVDLVGGSISNVNSVATNLATVNDFADKYRIGATDPTSNNDEGDLFYNTTSDALKVYTGSAWEQGVTAGSGFLPLSGGGLTGNLTTSALIDGRDVATDGTKLDGIEASADVTDTTNVVAALTAGTNVTIAANGTISSTDTDTVYTHPTHPGDDFSVDTGVLTGATVVSDIDINVTTDSLGHVTDANGSVATRTLTLADLGYTGATNATANVGDITGVTAGSGLSGGGTSGTVTLSHSDTSSQASSNNSGRTYIQDITLDTYGHVTGIATATETVTDTNTTYTAGGDYGMTLSGTEFRLEDDRRRNSTSVDIYSGNTHDYTFYDASHGIRWYTSGSEEMRLENDGDLHVDGNVVAYSTTVSDERLKTDIVKIDSALDKVNQLSGYTFTYIADGKKSAGVIAQEVQKVLPSAITESTLPLKVGEEDETEYMTVQYDQLVGLLVEAVKELKAELAELKGK